MPAPRRHRQFVFVLVPEERVAEASVLRTASMVCRIAHQMHLTPICPTVYYASFMTAEERTLELPKVARRWLRLCERIWLQFASNDDLLDAFSFKVLQENETSGVRLPVCQLERADDSIFPVPMARDEIRFMLGCNLDVGLARCA